MFEFLKFGLDFSDSKTEKEKNIQTVAPKPLDGSIQSEIDYGLNGSVASGFFHYAYSFESIYKDQKSKIELYRRMAQNPFISRAIEEIVNDAITHDVENGIVNVNLDSTSFSSPIKKKIIEEFDNVLRKLRFDFRGYDVFRDWYVDGQMYAHMIIDPKNTKEGIREIRFIDPRYIKKISEVKKDRRGIEVSREEFYAYFPEEETKEKRKNRQNISNPRAETTYVAKFNTDSIVYIWSGLLDPKGLPNSYLEYAIKAYNQLNSIEDALLIYRLSRAPEKRAFYVETEGLPKNKAEAFISQLMDKYKNKTTYDISTGEIRNNTQIQSMFHDYWLPRKGGKGTEVSTIGGTSGTFGDANEIEFFLKKLYESMKIPTSRIQNAPIGYGKGSEITREELKFQKFIDRLRNRFSELFSGLLKTQLLLKNIITIEDWIENEYDVRYKYSKDSMFEEFKNAEILEMRLDTLSKIKDFVGKKNSKDGYFNKDWVYKNVLMMNDEQIEDIQEIQDEEEANGVYDDTQAEAMGGDAIPGGDVPGPVNGFEPNPGATGTSDGNGADGVQDPAKIGDENV